MVLLGGEILSRALSFLGLLSLAEASKQDGHVVVQAGTKKMGGPMNGYVVSSRSGD
jgi:hypothetical protein